MADGDHHSSSFSSSKRKFDDPLPPPRRPTGFSSGPPLASPSPPRPPAGAGTAAAAAASYNSVPPPPDEIQLAKQRAQEIAARIFSAAEAKRPRVDNGEDAGGVGGGAGSGVYGFSGSGNDHRPVNQPMASHGGMSQYSTYGYQGTSKKIEIPNGRVGVIIGKAGETIKYLQLQSGAKIQVTRDMDADPNSQTRSVELSGTPEQIGKAEQLINEVLAEADAGSSGTISGRKFSAPQAGAEQFQMKIANNKVGLVIGKGGETIKSMQAKSGARIQVIPLHLPPGDTSTERTVYIDGTKEQIEAAKQLVNEVISENRARNPMAGGYSQQGYRPPRPPTNWAPPGAPPMQQQPGYGYMQPGAYPGATPQYGMPQPPYGSYPPPASGGYQSGWDQSSNPPAQQPAPGTGYDYYNQQQQPQQPQPVTGSSAPADATSYSYGQPPTYASQGYGDSAAAYSQQAGGQQAYSHDSYSTAYHTQGLQQGYSQPPQTGYDHQQSYGTSTYGAAANTTQDGSAPSYGAPGGNNQVSPAQQPPAPAPASGNQPGYASQPPTTTTSSYPAQGTAPSGYGLPPAPQSGYGGQPPSQPGYGQSPGYGQPPQGQKPPPTSPYGHAPPPGSTQAGYMQPPPYGQAIPVSGAPQAGYGQPPAYPGAPPPSHPSYSQQQPYGDSYGSGGYAQQPPAYSNEGAAPASQDQSTSTSAAAAAPPTPSAGTQGSPS